MEGFTLNTHHAYLNDDIIIKCNGAICIIDKTTGEEYQFVNEFKTRLCSGKHILISDDQEEEIIIEDAINLDGNHLKNVFVFDGNPWVFVSTKDCLCITNKETKEKKVEYNYTPDSITALGYINDYVFKEGRFQWEKKPCECFLFQTKNDYAIYDVFHGKVIFSFVNHIYSNDHLVIYGAENDIEVYDYRQKRVVVSFNGQYSFGNKFYFVKERKLYGLNTSSSFINAIAFVGEIGEEDVLIGNYLLKLDKDNSDKKEYNYVWLGNGEDFISKTKLIFPYYIENWKGKNTKSFQKTKELYNKFREESKGFLSGYSSIKCMCIGVRINRTIYEWKNHSRIITLYGEIIAYPALNHVIPFKLKGIEGETLDYSDATIEQMPLRSDHIETKTDGTEITFELNVGETVHGKSSSGNLLITKEGTSLFLRNIKENSREEILNKWHD